MSEEEIFKSNKLWVGLFLMMLSVVWAIASVSIDIYRQDSFSWFSASGAIMVSGSILFERLKPGAGLDGGGDIGSLPSVGQMVHHRDLWLMANGGYISIAVLLIGTGIWAYGSLLLPW